MHTRSALLPAIALSAMLLGGAAPLPPSPEQAKLLEAQITAWLTTMTGGMVKLPPQPVQLTPEGDHYLVHVPLGRLGTIDPPDAAFTAQARSLGGTRWALDNQQFPTALTIKTTEKEAAAPASDDAPATPQTVDVTYRLKIGQQDANSILDIAFATPTSGSSTFTAVDLLKEGGTAASLTHVDQIVSQSSTQPLDPAHADLLSDVTATGYAMKGSTPDGKNVALQIGRMHIVSTLSGLAHQQFVPLIEMAADLAHMTQASAGDKHDSLTPEEKAQLHTMLEQAHDILTGGKIDETLEALKFGMDDNAGSIERAELSVSGDAPADTLSASSTLSMTGLKIDSLPPEVAAYVPTRFTIHPTMSNLDLAALTKMALDATAPTLKGQPAAPNPSIAALFSKGGVALRLRRSRAGRGRTGDHRHRRFHQPRPPTRSPARRSSAPAGWTR